MIFCAALHERPLETPEVQDSEIQAQHQDLSDFFFFAFSFSALILSFSASALAISWALSFRPNLLRAI
jgi:hypothetical protein